MGGENAGNGWNEWKNAVLREQERQAESIKEIGATVTDIKVMIGQLQIRAGLWGALAGTIPGAVILILALLGLI